MSGRVVRTPAVSIEQVDVPAGTRLVGHAHDVPHLCFLEEGAFEERDAGRRRSVEPGTLRSSPAGDEHDIIFRRPSRCLLVLIYGDPAAVAPRLPTERQFLSTRRLRGISERLSGRLTSTAPLDIEAVVLELLAAALPEVQAHREAAPPPWLRRIRDRLHAAPTDPPSTFELAEDAGYHPVYVARAFRQFYGIGIREYARLARAEFAYDLLSTTGAPLAQVAYGAGYADQSHLTRSMRRLMNATPAEVRRKRGRIVQVSSIQDAGAIGS